MGAVPWIRDQGNLQKKKKKKQNCYEYFSVIQCAFAFLFMVHDTLEPSITYALRAQKQSRQALTNLMRTHTYRLRVDILSLLRTTCYSMYYST